MNHRVLRAIVIAVWAVFFGWLLLSGEVDRYIGPRTQWVIVFGTAALTVVGAGMVLSLRRTKERSIGSVLGVAAMLLPIVAVLVVPKPSLGSLAASLKLSGGPVVSLRPEPVGAGDEIGFREIEYASESSEYAAASGIVDGLEVELTGFVSHHETGEANFTLTRFAIFCCAADVVPHSITVDSSDTYEEDQWLTVTGRLAERDGVFVVEALTIEEISEPDDPYLR